MSISTETLSEAYRASALRVRQLHALIRRGEGDSREADDLRDELDGYWLRLTDQERTRIRSLSADLNMMDRSYPRSDDPKAAERFNEEFVPAQEDGDWDRALGMLRTNPGLIDKAHAVFLKGIFWARLGDFDSALVLLEEAVRTEPTNRDFAIAMLEVLAGLDRVREAAERAIAISERYDDVIPNDFLKLARTVVESWRTVKESENRLHEATQRVNEALTSLFDAKRAILHAARETHSGRSLFGDDESPDDDRLAIFAA